MSHIRSAVRYVDLQIHQAYTPVTVLTLMLQLGGGAIYPRTGFLPLTPKPLGTEKGFFDFPEYRVELQKEKKKISISLLVFTALHVLHASRSIHEKAVRPSVRLSNACTVTEQKKVLPSFLYHAKDNLSQFSEKKNGWWGSDPFYMQFLVKLTPLERNRRFSVDNRS